MREGQYQDHDVRSEVDGPRDEEVRDLVPTVGAPGGRPARRDGLADEQAGQGSRDRPHGTHDDGEPGHEDDVRAGKELAVQQQDGRLGEAQAEGPEELPGHKELVQRAQGRPAVARDDGVLVAVAQAAKQHAGDVGGVEADGQERRGEGAVVAGVEGAVRNAVREEAQGRCEGGDDAEEDADGEEALL